MWPFSTPNAVKCGACKGTGTCPRCHGTGTAEQTVDGNFVCVDATCNRCKGNGVCVGCRGCGWLGVKHPEK